MKKCTMEMKKRRAAITIKVKVDVCLGPAVQKFNVGK